MVCALPRPWRIHRARHLCCRAARLMAGLRARLRRPQPRGPRLDLLERPVLHASAAAQQRSANAAHVSLPAAWKGWVRRDRLNSMQDRQSGRMSHREVRLQTQAHQEAETQLTDWAETYIAGSHAAVVPSHQHGCGHRGGAGGQAAEGAVARTDRTRERGRAPRAPRVGDRRLVQRRDHLRHRPQGGFMHCCKLACSCASADGTNTDAGGAVADGPARGTPCFHLVNAHRHVQHSNA